MRVVRGQRVSEDLLQRMDEEINTILKVNTFMSTVYMCTRTSLYLKFIKFEMFQLLTTQNGQRGQVEEGGYLLGFYYRLLLPNYVPEVYHVKVYKFLKMYTTPR